MRHLKGMKVMVVVLIAVCALGAIAEAQGGGDRKAEGQTIKVMTYNWTFAKLKYWP